MQDSSVVNKDEAITPEKKKKKKRKKTDDDEEGTQPSSEATADTLTEGTSEVDTEVRKDNF